MTEAAVPQTCRALARSSLLLCAGALAAVLTADGAIPPIAVVVLAIVVAGEQLWRRRERIPADVPAPLAPTDRVASARIDRSDLAIAVLVFGVLVGLSAILGGASVALIGFPAGFVLRDVVMLIGVARWQRRHGCRLAWIDDGDGVTPRVLPTDLP